VDAVNVRFGVPGLGFVDEVYDYDRQTDVEAFDKNVRLGYLVIWIKRPAMTRETFVVSNGALVPWAEVAAQRRERLAHARSTLPAPMIIRDYLDGVVNPCDGKQYDSKSAYYQAVKDAGCVIVGNEAEKMMSAPPARSDVKSDEIVDAMKKVEAGYKPATLGFDGE
jgi:hypothetical protein